MGLIGKLNAVKVAREKRPGLYSDGGGLYLQVGKPGTKSWIFRYWVPERDPSSGDLVIDATTGSARAACARWDWAPASLSPCRTRASGRLECRKLREKEIDPIAAREASRREAALQQRQSR